MVVSGKNASSQVGQNDTLAVMLLALPSGAGTKTMEAPSDGMSVSQNSSHP